jgi:hypothetical protein
LDLHLGMHNSSVWICTRGQESTYRGCTSRGQGGGRPGPSLEGWRPAEKESRGAEKIGEEEILGGLVVKLM